MYTAVSRVSVNLQSSSSGSMPKELLRSSEAWSNSGHDSIIQFIRSNFRQYMMDDCCYCHTKISSSLMVIFAIEGIKFYSLNLSSFNQDATRRWLPFDMTSRQGLKR